MGKPLKRPRKVDDDNESESESESEPELNSRDSMENGISPDEYDDLDDNNDYSVEGSDEMDDEDEDEHEDVSESQEKREQDEEQKDAELAQLEKEISLLQHEEQDILKNLKQHKDEDLQKGQAVKNQKALWDKVLEFRFLLQKAFSSCNRLPQEPIRSSFCSLGSGVSDAYSDLITSSTKTLDSILQLQEALLERNPTITQSTEGGANFVANSVRQSQHPLDTSGNSSKEGDEEWVKIFQMHSRMNSFRDKSIDKWYRKTQVTTGTAAIRGKLNAFNQDISEQVAAYMRDPSKMIKGMRLNRSAIALFGNVLESTSNVGTEGESVNGGGDPELLDDSGFYQYLLKEFFETIDATSSEKAFYALKRLQTKKRKLVDRRASKSRKIRYNIHEKIVNFMAPEPMNIPPMAPKLFENLFNLKSSRPTSVE